MEQALLYLWTCFTSCFELHRSQDERFSAPSSLEVTDLFAVSDRGVFVMVAELANNTKIIQIFEVSSLSCNQ